MGEYIEKFKDADHFPHERDMRQLAVFEWAKEAFTSAATTPNERAARFLEEALELAQAQGIAQSYVEALTKHVYSKPIGEVKQEVGGCGVTLLAYCESVGVSADDEEYEEVKRVIAIDPSYFRKRHNIKAAAGVAVKVDE